MSAISKVACGKKFCTHCGRWRHVIDFNVREWNRGKTVAIYFVSICKTCLKVKHRERNGYKAFHGRSPRAAYERRLAKNRESAARRRQDPERAALEREYHRIWRDAKAAEEGREHRHRPHHKNRVTQPRATRLRSGPFLAWLDGFLAGRPYSELALASGVSHKVIWNAREEGFITDTSADRVFIAAGVPWMLAVLYPPDEGVTDEQEAQAA